MFQKIVFGVRPFLLYHSGHFPKPNANPPLGFKRNAVKPEKQETNKTKQKKTCPKGAGRENNDI